jgi:hypothetical protein
VLASRYFGRNTVARLVRQIQSPFEKQFGGILQRLDRHSKAIDKTAVAVELFKASEHRKEQERAARVTLKLEIERWIKPVNMKSVHQDQVQKRLPGTCEWIWTNSTFQEWMRSSSQIASDRLLTVHGIHGAAKSILASATVSHYRDRGRRCLFFAFSGSDSCRQTSESLVKTCLWQMLQYASDTNTLEILTELMAKHEATEYDYWDAMSMISGEESICIVVDGVDESTEPCQILTERLIKLLRRKPKYRVVVFGRSYALAGTTQATRFSIDLSGGLNKNDIDAYISAAVLNDVLLSERGTNDKVLEALQTKAGGMFLWAKLMIDHLSRSANKDEALKRLEDLPRGLERAYVLILSRLVSDLDPRDLEFVKKILEITTIARRPLTIEETRIAHALSTGTGSAYATRLDSRLEQKIFDLCGGLIIAADGYLNLVHFSLKEFLTRCTDDRQQYDNFNLRLFHINFEAADKAFGIRCSEYLLTVDYGSPFNEVNSLWELPLRYQFLDYASRYMMLHLLSAEISELLPNIIEFIVSEVFIPFFEYFFIILVDPGLERCLFDGMNSFYSNCRSTNNA